jgi:mRNA deadenylase 3'-5' endonuclease subunit Ccr4
MFFFASSVCNCLVLPMLVFSTKRLSESSFYLNSFCVSKFDTSWNIIVGCNIYLRFWHLSATCTYLCFKEKILQKKKKKHSIENEFDWIILWLLLFAPQNFLTHPLKNTKMPFSLIRKQTTLISYKASVKNMWPFSQPKEAATLLKHMWLTLAF